MSELDWLNQHIRNVPDFPRPGVVFKDITPLLSHGNARRTAFGAVADPFSDLGIDKVVGIESRGFILAAPVADRLTAGLVLMRKPGKLPWKTVSEPYTLEYGDDALEVHEDSIATHDRVLIVDDVLATGGTASAAVRLVERLGGTVVGCSFLIELRFLRGRAKLGDRPVHAVLRYD